MINIELVAQAPAPQELPATDIDKFLTTFHERSLPCIRHDCDLSIYGARKAIQWLNLMSLASI